MPIHNVGKVFSSWNNHQHQPVQITINSEAYDKKFPMNPAQKALASHSKIESSHYCTQCHAIGKIPLLEKGEWGGSCDHFIRSWADSTHDPISIHQHHTDHGLSSFFWMPPGAHNKVKSKEEWDQRYGRAMEALKYCCSQQDFSAPEAKEICLSSHTS